tara:strand:+ start:259 stop:684 length:426 start_codon:yes stop_codon:yes gene_type:complete
MKITKINEPTPWEGQHGTMYEALLSFDDGTSGRVNMKSPDRWNIGDEIEVTDRQPNDKYGDKLKIQKPQGDFPAKSFPSSGGKFDPEIQWKIDTSWAITSAINILGETAKEHSKDGGLIATAKHLLNLREAMITELKESKG